MPEELGILAILARGPVGGSLILDHNGGAATMDRKDRKNRLAAAIEQLPRVRLAYLPAPLEEAPKL